MSEQTIRAGVVGFGLAGQVFHAAVIDETPGIELASVVERSKDLAAAKYPGIRVARSVDEMLADPSINLCVVATANDSHFPVAETCLRAGRNVVIDKPFTLSSRDAERLAALARERGLVLSAYHNRRFDGDFLTLRELLASGRLGEPVLFESHFDRFRPGPKEGAWRERPEAGGGTLLDLGPHLIDQALALFGAPTSLWADVRTQRPGSAVDDTFDILLRYDASPNETLRPLRVWLRAAVIAASPGPRFTLHGTRGSYEKWGLDQQEPALKGGAKFSDPGFGSEPESEWGTLTLAGATPVSLPTLDGDYRKYYADVRDAILGQSRLTVGAGEAWSVARLIELARESSASGCRVAVDLARASEL